MPNLLVHTGPLKSYYYFEDEIIQSIQNIQQNFLAILPVNRAVRIFKRKLIDASPAQTLMDPFVFTFDELLLKIYRMLPKAKRIITNEMLLLLVENILSENQNELVHLKTGGDVTTGLIKKTVDVISELRRFGYDGREFELVESPDKIDSPLKFSDFEIILNSLDQKLGSNLIDEPFAQHTASKMLTQEHFVSLFPEVDKLYINGYGLFTPAMYQFIEKVSQWIQVKIKLEYNETNPTLFSHTASAFDRFRQMGAEIVGQKSKSAIADYLFNRTITKRENLDLDDRIEIQALKHRNEEVAFIASKIRQVHLNGGIPFNKIAVTFSNMERYVPLLRQQFKDYQIPFNLSTGFTLTQSPLIRTFLNCLSLIESGFEYRNVLQFFNLSFIKKPESYNSTLLYRRFVEERVRYLSEDRLFKLSTSFQNNENQSQENLNEFDSIGHQVRILSGLLKPLFDFPKKSTVSGFRSSFINLLDTYGLLSWYQKSSENLTERQQENEFRAFNRFMKLLDKLIWTLNYLYGDQEIALTVFYHHLRTAVERSIYNLTEWPDYGVQIMPRLEIQALDFDVLFIGGLIDGEFPRASTKDVFFSDTVREQMGLLASEELLDQDRFIFYTLLDSKADKIFLTYPKYEDDRALVPSTFLSDLKEIAMISEHHEIEDHTFLNQKKMWNMVGFDVQFNRFKEAEEKTALLLKLTHTDNTIHNPQIIWLFDKIEKIQQRIITGGFSNVEGNLSLNIDIRNYLNKTYSSQSWSITLLEEYAFCPMQFFLDRILGVEDLPTFDEDLSSLERGNIIHKILHNFYNELRKRNRAAYPAQNRDLLISIATDLFNRLPFNGFFWDLERMIYFGDEKNQGLLDKFLEYDQDQIEKTGYIPSLFEFGFGYTGESEKDQMSGGKTVTIKGDNGAIKINGKIDRVDFDDYGHALIIDYKTGIQSTKVRTVDILNGIRFQLPLYMLALEELNNSYKAVYGGYYLVKDSENCERKDVLADKSIVDFVSGRTQAGLPNNKIIDENGNQITLENLLRHSVNQAINKVNELKNGQFQHTKYPEDPGCDSYCEFRRICQKNVGKIKRMREKEII